jgi:hypothetical protein
LKCSRKILVESLFCWEISAVFCQREKHHENARNIFEILLKLSSIFVPKLERILNNSSALWMQRLGKVSPDRFEERKTFQRFCIENFCCGKYFLI